MRYCNTFSARRVTQLNLMLAWDHQKRDNWFYYWISLTHTTGSNKKTQVARPSFQTKYGSSLTRLYIISNVKVKIQPMFKWCICNKLTINCDKTYFVLFHTVNKPVPDDLIEIVTPQMTIKRATEMKYLGLLLDQKLNYNEHVQSICNSILKYFGIFNHIKHKVNKKTARQLYFAFVSSRIKYGIEIYGNCSERNVNKIHTMQNKLLKLLLQLDRLTPTSVLHKNLNILKINDLYKCSVLLFVNDTQIGKCPKIFPEKA